MTRPSRRGGIGALGLDIEAPFARILDVARLALDVPMAGVGIMEGARERFVARHGPLPEELPRDASLCDIALKDGAPLRIRDAAADPVLSHLPAVAGAPNLRGFMAVPLDISGEGTLCVGDHGPRDFSEHDLDLLRAIARLVEGEIGLRHVALTDALTGLASRGAWMDAARRAEARAARGQPWSVILVDLDDFKEVNDTHGHAAGDAVLQEAARRVSGALRRGDMVGRIGGDEFAVLVEGDAETARWLAARLTRGTGAAPVRHEGARLPLSASTGWARIGPDGLGAAMEAADEGLYRDKDARRAA